MKEQNQISMDIVNPKAAGIDIGMNDKDGKSIFDKIKQTVKEYKK